MSDLGVVNETMQKGKKWHFFAQNPDGILSVVSIPDALVKSGDRWAASGNADNGRSMRSDWKCDFANFGTVDLPEQIDWSLGQPGRDNLSWQLHSFSFVRDLTAAYIVDADDWYISRIKSVVRQWARANIVPSPPSAFSWNDHSTALRLTVLGQLVAFLKARNLLDVDFFWECLKLAYRHQQVLLSEDFYVRGTNHGLDQAFSLYQSMLFFGTLKQSAAAKQVAMQRLTFEVGKSFSDDGVHIENSPQYHETILASVLQIERFVESFEGAGFIENSQLFASNALEYLAYIIRPDGCHPPIGDTIVQPPVNNFAWLASCDAYKHFLYTKTKGEEGVDAPSWHRVFPHSGYAIFRGNPAKFSAADRPHIVFKCGYLSYYHRQDDDNNIVVFAFGEEWLTDGGLYKHDHVDPQREHMRSHFAHNVMAPVGVKAARRYCPSTAPRIDSYSSDEKSAWVRGITTMFPGYTYQRTFAYDGEYGMSVEDIIAPTTPLIEAMTYEQYWQIPADKCVDISSTLVTIRSEQSARRLVVQFNSSNLISIEEMQPSDGSYFGWRSVEYGKLERVRTIRLVLRGSGPASVSASFIFCLD